MQATQNCAAPARAITPAGILGTARELLPLPQYGARFLTRELQHLYRVNGAELPGAVARMVARASACGDYTGRESLAVELVELVRMDGVWNAQGATHAAA